MVLAVRDHADTFYQTARALKLAQKYQIPVLVLGDQVLADSSATFTPLDIQKGFRRRRSPARRGRGTPEPYLRYALTASGISPMHVPGKSDAVVRADSDEHSEAGTITEDAQVRVQMVDKARAQAGRVDSRVD